MFIGHSRNNKKVAGTWSCPYWCPMNYIAKYPFEIWKRRHALNRLSGMGPRPSGSRQRPRPRPELPRPRRDRDVCQTVRDETETRPSSVRDETDTRPFSGRDYIETHGLYMHGICTSHCIQKKESLRLGWKKTSKRFMTHRHRMAAILKVWSDDCVFIKRNNVSIWCSSNFQTKKIWFAGTCARDLNCRDRGQDRDLSSRDRDETETFAYMPETRPRRDRDETFDKSRDRLETETSRPRPHPCRSYITCYTILNYCNEQFLMTISHM